MEAALTTDWQRKPSDVFSLLNFVVLLWIIEVIDLLISFVGIMQPMGLDRFGVTPRNLGGLFGIIPAPLLHGGFAHLLSNTIPLLICGVLAIKLNPTIWRSALWWSWLFAGLFAWLIADDGEVHIGASGVVFGLIGFLLVAGVVQGRILAFLAALLVGFLFGTALFTALPQFTEGSDISWESHLGGLLAGAFTAYRLRKVKP